MNKVDLPIPPGPYTLAMVAPTRLMRRVFPLLVFAISLLPSQPLTWLGVCIADRCPLLLSRSDDAASLKLSVSVVNLLLLALYNDRGGGL